MLTFHKTFNYNYFENCIDKLKIYLNIKTASNKSNVFYNL